ncbi:MAG: rhomboid family intramembrane serine protease [Anaerolineaceae bacterium]|jgi:rhomboid protease GluP
MQNHVQYDPYQQSQTPPPGTPVAVKLPGKKPNVTYVLIGVTVFFYILQILSQSLSADGYDWPLLLGGKINELILQGQLWRLLTPALLHGSLVHIAFNMYALFSLGTSLERYFGPFRFLLLYGIGAFCGNTLSFLLSPKVSIGASTAVFALVAAEAVFIYRNRSLFGGRARTMLSNLGLIIAVNLVIGLQPGIDNWGHLGGLIGGAIFAWFAGPLMRMQTTFYGYELADTSSRRETFIGTLLAGGMFLVLLVIGLALN